VVAGTMMFSVMVIGINMIRRSHRGGSVVCSRCGVKNSSGTKFCVGCGESLKRP
jgi:formylmethanofuran dehydrogenase subunit E